MMHLTIPMIALLLATGLLWLGHVQQRKAANARAIAMHIVTNTVPMLERHGFVMDRKQVSFGGKPHVKFNMASAQGLWIDLLANHKIAYFHLSTMSHTEDGPLDLPHAFEVSGPWDELTEVNLTRWESNFHEWRGSGCRIFSMRDQPGDYISYYLPALCHYVTQGGLTERTYPGDRNQQLYEWFEKAPPHERYPLVPLLARP